MSAVQFRLSSYWLGVTAKNRVPEEGKQKRTEAIQLQSYLALGKYLLGSNNHLPLMRTALHKVQSQSLSNWFLTNIPETKQYDFPHFIASLLRSVYIHLHIKKEIYLAQITHL